MIHVEVVYCPAPGRTEAAELALPDGATLRDALTASGIAARHGLALDEALWCGVWGRRQGLDHRLRERDRVELYRPLQCDPKEARRLRYRQKKAQGAKAAGGGPAAGL
jgi:uncharacterized protein